MDMVRKLKSEISLITLDNDKIRTVCEKLLYDNRDCDRAVCNLTRLVKRRLDPSSGRLPQPNAFQPHPIIRRELIDNNGNLRATDIGITWTGSDTFLHGVKIVEPDVVEQHTGPRPATSTPCQPVRDHAGCNMSTPRQPPTLPPCLEIPDTCTPLRRPPQENRQGYQPAAPIQRFNNKSLNWPSWFRHLGAVADVRVHGWDGCTGMAVHGWDDHQRALHLVSYLDETAMNVAQELCDDELYDYDILVNLLGDRFDIASHVLASRFRFHGRLRHHHEDADSFADTITDLCRVGYPQSSPELRQELISEQFMRGQLDPELKKYLCVVIRTQKDRKLQTLIEVCTDFASLGTSSNIHRAAEQVFAVEEDSESEDMFAMAERPPWTGQSNPDSTVPPTLQQLFALAWKMGYEMRPIARRLDNTHQPSGSPRAPFTPIQGYFHHSGLVVIFQGSSASVAVNSDILRLVARSQTRLFRINRPVGICNLIINNIRTSLHRKETLIRPGPHPYRSECNTSGLHFIFTP